MSLRFCSLEYIWLAGCGWAAFMTLISKDSQRQRLRESMEKSKEMSLSSVTTGQVPSTVRPGLGPHWRQGRERTSLSVSVCCDHLRERT